MPRADVAAGLPTSLAGVAMVAQVAGLESQHTSLEPRPKPRVRSSAVTYSRTVSWVCGFPRRVGHVTDETRHEIGRSGPTSALHPTPVGAIMSQRG
jgi:hypothetical protein